LLYDVALDVGGAEGAAEGQGMASKVRRSNTETARADDGPAPRRRDEAWDERLRLVGDANFVHVPWSGKDDPSWPLPKK
jgi:hypothetical protein